MDYNKIKTLLDKYFEGKTSLSEENLLSEYFNQSDDIHPDFEYAKDMFQYFKKNQEFVVKKILVSKDYWV